MNILPDPLYLALCSQLGGHPTNSKLVKGGMINQSAYFEVNRERYFMKWNDRAQVHFFEAEARGMALLRETGAFRIPTVIAYTDVQENIPAHMILEWIDGTPNADDPVFLAKLGHAFADLHRHTATTFGLDHDNYTGWFLQRNTPLANWAAFYRDQRLAIQMEYARELGYLPAHRESLIQQVMEKAETILADVAVVPSLIHGDVWSGNFLDAGGDLPIVFDPAVFYSSREVEIAYTQMFDGLPSAFYDAYNEAYPLDVGYEYRRPLLQLCPMLVHLNHFGEEFGSQVDDLCKHYLT